MPFNFAEQDVNEYLQEMRQKGVSEDVIADMAATLNEGKRGYLRQSDYSRYMDSLKATQAKQTEWWNENQARLEEADRLRQQYGDPADFSSTSNPNVMRDSAGRFRSADEVEQLRAKLDELEGTVRQQHQQLAQVGTAAVQLTTFIPRAMRTYEKKYGKEFNTQEFQEFCAKNPQIQDLDVLLDRFSEPEETALRERDLEAKLAAARAEGEQNALSRLGNPADPGATQGGSNFFKVRGTDPAAVPSEADRRSSFAQAFNKAVADGLPTVPGG